jgi:hypothetical protein
MLLAARPALAAPISLTGSVAQDFNPATNPGVQTTPVSNSPLDIGEASFIPANGWVSGWAIQDIRTYYNSSNDTLYVGIEGFKNASGQYAIFGDADGNPNPNVASPQMAAEGGLNTPHLGGDKSIAIAFAPINLTNPNQPGSPTVIAGVPADKSKVGSGTIDGYTVSQYSGGAGLQYSFGQQLPQFTGNLAFDPSAAHPQLEFTIPNFSKIPGLNGLHGYWLSMYAGSAQDIVAGEAGTGWVKVPQSEAQQIPEPATWLAWMVLAAAAVGRCRARRACP